MNHMNDALYTVDHVDHDKYVLHAEARSLDHLKAAWLQMGYSIREFEKNEADKAQAAAQEAARYFPQEKFTAPKGSDYTINDYIKLAARDSTGNAGGDMDAVRILQRWGCWWKVRAAAQKGAAWLLQSIGDQPRELSKKLVHELLMVKDLDPHFAAVAVLKYPTAFNYKLAETGARVNG